MKLHELESALREARRLGADDNSDVLFDAPTSEHYASNPQEDLIYAEGPLSEVEVVNNGRREILLR